MASSMHATVLIDKIASKYSVAQSLLVATFIFNPGNFFSEKNCFVNLQTRISTSFSSNNYRLGRTFPAIFLFTKSVSKVLQVPNRCVFEFIVMSTALFLSANSSI